MQRVLSGGMANGRYGLSDLSHSPRRCFTDVWDPLDGRFKPCFLPVLAALPAIVSICILFIQALGSLIRWRPQWTKQFIVEEVVVIADVGVKSKKAFWGPTVGLVGLALLGLITQVLESVLIDTSASVVDILPSIPWVSKP